MKERRISASTSTTWRPRRAMFSAMCMVIQLLPSLWELLVITILRLSVPMKARFVQMEFSASSPA